MIKRDCYWHGSADSMNANMEYCELSDQTFGCSCSDDCENYISTKEVTRQLKYRIPAKVTHTATLYKCCTCPSCGNVLDQFDELFGKKVRVTVNYCHFCGQALDWSDEEKQTITL